MRFQRWKVESPRMSRPGQGDPTTGVKRGGRVAAIPILAGFAAGVGALAAYLFDPDRGRGRRSKLRDQLAGLIRRGGRRLSRGTRYAAATTSGRLRGLRHAFGGDGSAETPTDAVLAHRVETELFRDPSIPKGRMNVNAEEGTVVLRGTVDSSDQLRAIEARVASIGGVTEVRNLLHLQGTAAPHEPAAAR